MRVLSIGHPLPNAAIDNRSIFDAPALFDYEAIVIDPAAVQESIREAALATAPHATSSGVPVVNGESIGGAAGLAELLHRRRDELARALERGAVVAVYLHPPSQVTEVAGMSGLDRYFLLPAPAGMGWDARTVRGGEGRSGAIVDQAHPFSAVVEETRRRLSYRAYLDDRAPGVAEHAHTFVRSTGGAPIGAQIALLGGQLVFLPAIEGADAMQAMPEAKAMVAAMQETLGRVDDDRVPRWLAAQPVPGLEERERTLGEARAERDRAQTALDEAEAATAELSALREVLWRAGEHAMLPAVVRCAELLGFRAREDGQGWLLTAPEGELLLEAEAAEAEVGMAPHYRLRARADRLLEERARPARGLVVISGQRMTEPEKRGVQHADALRVAAESVGYALLTVGELFDAATAALAGGADEATIAEWRARLLAADGVVTLLDRETAEFGAVAPEAAAAPAPEAGEPAEAAVER
jgi:hypothetical protein